MRQQRSSDPTTLQKHMFFNYTSYGARRVSLRGNFLHGKIIVFFTVSNIAILFIFTFHVQAILSHVTKRLRLRFFGFWTKNICAR